MRKQKLHVALCSDRVQENYSTALREAGRAVGIRVEPVWFAAFAREDMKGFAEFHVEDFDGLLIPGGGDMDPSFFGEENCGSNSPDPDFDRFQLAMAEAFVKATKPILGICRGHQLLNVYFGGSLIQDIPQKKDHMHREDDTDSRHIINAREGSLLRELYGASFAVNSSHHQAVKVPGKGLTATAVSEDGVNEALEHETLPIISVQFHPERMDYFHKREDTVAGGRIFDRFLQMMQQQAEKT